MEEMEIKSGESTVVGSSQQIVLPMEIMVRPLEEIDGLPVEVGAAPATLWLRISQHKEFPIGYRHAWGTAHVSTREDGGDSFPVQSLRLQITMPVPAGSPGGPLVSNEARGNAADCAADCKYNGVPPAIGDFSSRWDAWATHPGYGTWTTGNHW
jgi:hypothetical protein